MTQRQKLIFVNALSLSRVFIGPVLLLLVMSGTTEHLILAGSLYLYALASDFLDGLLARKWGVTSRFGFLVDGLGDMSVSLAVLFAIFIWYEVSLIIVFLFVMRDIIGFAFLAFHNNWYVLVTQSKPWTKGPYAVVLAGNMLLMIPAYFTRLGTDITLGGVWADANLILTVTVIIHFVALFAAMYSFWPKASEAAG